MSSTYTGNGGNVAQSTSPTATIPSDGDALAAVSVNTPLQRLLDHIALIWAGAFTGSPALKATAAGGAAPTRGSLNLVPENAPSAPADGDVWVELTTNQLKARINGVTQAIGQSAAFFSGTAGNTAATSFYLFPGGGQAGTAAPTIFSLANSSGVIFPKTVTILGLSIVTSNTTAGGTILVRLNLNVGGPQANVQITLTAGSVAGLYTATVATPVVVNPATTGIVGIEVNNGAVTTGLGACVASLLYA